MEAATLLLGGIIAVLFLLIATLVVLIVYSGVLFPITVGAGPPPIGDVKVFYKFGRGPYKNVGPLFTELASLFPSGRCLGIYYDNPKQVAQHKMRYAVCCVVEDQPNLKAEEMMNILEKHKYQPFQLPQVSNAVTTKFPFRSQLSIFIGIYRVYPALGSYITEKKLCAYPMLEIYDKDYINYMAPLARQDEFFVPEALEEEDEEEEEASRPADESLMEAEKDSQMTEGAYHTQGGSQEGEGQGQEHEGQGEGLTQQGQGDAGGEHDLPAAPLPASAPGPEGDVMASSAGAPASMLDVKDDGQLSGDRKSASCEASATPGNIRGSSTSGPTTVTDELAGQEGAAASAP